MKALNRRDFIDSLSCHLKDKTPMSYIRTGDGFNQILAYDTIIKKEKYQVAPMKHLWPVSSASWFPKITSNLPLLQSTLSEAARKATVLGLLDYNDTRISAPEYVKRPLTDRVLKHYGISPSFSCSACLSYDLAVDEDFWKSLSGYRVLLVSGWSASFVSSLKRLWLGRAVDKIHFDYYHDFGFADIEKTLADLKTLQFDTMIESCGIQGKILCSRAGRELGKVALDFGRAMQIVASGKPELLKWKMAAPFGIGKQDIY